MASAPGEAPLGGEPHTPGRRGLLYPATPAEGSPGGRSLYSNLSAANTAAAGPCRWVADFGRSDACCGRLRTLRLGSLLPDRVVGELLSRCGKLQRLDAARVDKLADATLLKVSSPCLREVELMRCFRLTDAAVAHLADTCPHLQRLLLQGCRGLTDASLEALLDGACVSRTRSLHTLGVSAGLGGITAAGVQRLLDRRACPGLRNLLLFEARFEGTAGEEGAGWLTVLQAAWRRKRPGPPPPQLTAAEAARFLVPPRPPGPEPTVPPLLLCLVCPTGLTDGVAEAFLAWCRDEKAALAAAAAASEAEAAAAGAGAGAASSQAPVPVTLQMRGLREVSDRLTEALVREMADVTTPHR